MLKVLATRVHVAPRAKPVNIVVTTYKRSPLIRSHVHIAGGWSFHQMERAPTSTKCDPAPPHLLDDLLGRLRPFVGLRVVLEKIASSTTHHAAFSPLPRAQKMTLGDRLNHSIDEGPLVYEWEALCRLCHVVVIAYRVGFPGRESDI